MSAPQEQRPTDSFGRPLAIDAIAIDVLMPRRDRVVLLYVEDLSVAIKGVPTVGWNSGTNEAPIWWTGLPANYIALSRHRWNVTHWAALPGDDESRAYIAKATAPPATHSAEAPDLLTRLAETEFKQAFEDATFKK